MRKFKLLSSISAFVLCLAMLVFGVYSAHTVNYTSSGTLTYTVKDVFVTINTKLLRATDNTTKTQAELDTMFNTLQGASDFDSINGVEVVSTKTEVKSYNTSTITNPNATMNETENFTLVFDEYNANNQLSYAYYIVTTVSNDGNAAVGVTATTTVPVDSNTYYKSTGNKNIAADGTQNFVFATGLKDQKLSVNVEFSYALSIGKNAVVEPMDMSTPVALSNLTPSQIQQVGAAGHVNAENSRQWMVGDDVWFNVGDEVTMTLTDNTQVVLQLADFNHDVDANNETIPFTFVCKYLLPNTYNHCMNPSTEQDQMGTNVGGWPQSSMYSYLNGNTDSIWSKIPTAWQQVIVPAVKSTLVGGGQGREVTNKETSTDKLFLLSMEEVGFDLTVTIMYGENCPNIGEGRIYPIFTLGNSEQALNSRIKTQSGSAAWWWLRSPDSALSGYFNNVDGGYDGCLNASAPGGVVFAFCM